MKLVEIVTPGTLEHRREIRRMTKGLKISYKRWEAVVGLATDGLALALIVVPPIALAVAFVRWWIV